jgi:hypothetical protein
MTVNERWRKLVVSNLSGNTARICICEPGTGAMKAKTRYLVRLNGFLEFGGNTADLDISEPGTGAYKSKKPISPKKYRLFKIWWQHRQNLY